MGEKPPERPRSVAIEIGPGATNNVIQNLTVVGYDVGIELAEGSSLTLTDATFDRVERPFKVKGPSSASVERTRIRNDPKQLGTYGGTQLGWEKPQGPALPAYCDKCEAIFPSQNYTFGGAFFTAWDNEETCPECGNEHAKLSEGLFRLTEEAVEVIFAPDVTHEMLAVLREQSQSVISGHVSLDAAAANLDAVSPKLGALLKRAAEIGGTAIALIAAIAGAYYGREAYLVGEKQLAAQQEANRSSDQVTEQVLRALERVTITLEGIRDNTIPRDRQRTGTQEASPELRRAEDRSAKKLKSRETRRIESRERRSQFGRSRHR